VSRAALRAPLYIKRADIPRLKREALALAKSLVDAYAALYGVRYRAITIRAQKTRWGSCSRAGNLSFNYRIAALPPHMAEYIVVHEVCHLIELNHSRRFWTAVERTIPDHAARKKELRHFVTIYT
jgi:predicted metal-dependent hydrolase